ncbi:MAG: ribonuclease III domain-containing protein [Oceanipulchritudo sp.]
MDVRELRELAWIGDAVLALYAREWLLEQADHPLLTRQELFVRLTSNAFLATLGEPTRVEAEIGKVYLEEGLEAAVSHIGNRLKPRFEQQLANLHNGRRTKDKRQRTKDEGRRTKDEGRRTKD